MALSVGDRLGPYAVLAQIGAGGMGEVYEARDTRLDRTVAIKVLPEHIAAREDLRARFEREARAVASLNHPNICTLYDIGNQDGVGGFMVMELIEGESLAQRIEKGGLPLDQALKAATQIADALDRAHRAGVTHRDIKPQNIMLTRDGVKVLDFGLAKSVASKPGPTEATLTKVLTTEGTVMGTPQYMAPEQFEGKEADARSDIWAFGAVLYEMVTGQKAFQGKSYSSLVGAILSADPVPMAVKPFTPASLERLVRRCLQKDPEDRWQTMRDIVIELRTPPQEPAAAVAPRKAHLPWVIVAGVMTLLAAGVSALYLSHKPPVGQLMKFQIQPTGQDTTQFLELSPDGRMLAFVANTGSVDQLWLRSMDSLEARMLPGTDGAIYPFWSPDSAWLGYFARGQLNKIAVAGGPPQKLCDTGEGRGGTWNQDGVILFSPGPNTPLLRVPATGGDPAPAGKITNDGRDGHHYPAFLPDGDHFLVGSFVGSLKGGAQIRITAERGKTLYAPPSVPGETGYLLFRRDETLMAQSFDPASLKLSGEAVPVATQVPRGRNAGTGVFSVSATGALVYASAANADRQLAWIDRAGKRLGVVGKPDRYQAPALSPDEKSVAINILKSNGSSDIWVADLSREVLSRLTFRQGESLYPIWSPDGKSIVFGVRRGSPVTDFYRKPLGGERAEELLFNGGINGAARDISQDGKWFLYTNQSPTTGRDLWLAPLQGDRKPVPYLQTRFNEYFARFSPDAKWIAYDSEESGRSEIYVQTVPAGGAKFQISTDGGAAPVWRQDGKELYYLSPDRKLMAVPIRNGSTIEAGAPQTLFTLRVSQSVMPVRDGQRFLVVEAPDGDEAAAVPPVTIVLNWQTELKK